MISPLKVTHFLVTIFRAYFRVRLRLLLVHFMAASTGPNSNLISEKYLVTVWLYNHECHEIKVTVLPKIHCWTYWGEMFLNFNFFLYKLLIGTTNKCPVTVWEQTTARKDERWYSL